MAAVKKMAEEMEDLPQVEENRIKKKYESEIMAAMEKFLLECKRLMGLDCLDGDIKKILDQFG